MRPAILPDDTRVCRGGIGKVRSWVGVPAVVYGDLNVIVLES
jgi:hypothetical protein